MLRGSKQGTTVQLGHLKVGEQIGSGGFGVVHKATLDGINMTFAVKFLKPSVGNDDLGAATKRFFREAELLFRFRHPHIVPIYGVGEHEGMPYILMEHFQGMNLIKARETVGTPDPQAVLPFVEFVAGALAYAHQKNVIHRDIKPQNLMALKGDARVLDFGIAGLLDPGGERFTKSSDAVAGDSFSAPELTEKPNLLDPRCDIYSLGACWYWLLTGTSPKGVNSESRLRSSVTMQQAYERVLLRCLDAADRRYATAFELVDDIRALRRGDAPAHSPHDLNDDQARVLAVIVGACPTSRENIAMFGLEQELGARQTRLRTSLALRGLVKKKMIHEDAHQGQYDDDPYSVYWPLEIGTEWIERNLLRVEELQEAPKIQTVEALPESDEIPF